MNWDAVSAVGEVLGAIAVIVTLLYLAVQVRQARMAQRLDSVRTNRNERREFFTAVRDSPYLPPILAKLEAGEDITAEESIRLMNHYSAHWGLIFSHWVQIRTGLPEEFQPSLQPFLVYSFLQPECVNWFEQYGRAIYPVGFTTEVDKALREHEADAKNQAQTPADQQGGGADI